MTRYVAFLRGINLGKRRIAMTHLTQLFEELGFARVNTFIASGNVLFSSDVSESHRLHAIIDKHLEVSLGYHVESFVRTADEVAAIARARVFGENGDEWITIHVGFMRHKLSPAVARKFRAVRTSEDEFQVIGREYYWLCRTRVSECGSYQR